MPDWKSLVRQRLKPLQLGAAAESDLVEEVAQHLEDLFGELRSGGAGAEEACRSERRQYAKGSDADGSRSHRVNKHAKTG